MKHAPNTQASITLRATALGGVTAGLDSAHTGAGLAELLERLGKTGAEEIAIERPNGRSCPRCSTPG
jgi:hypothetical protein